MKSKRKLISIFLVSAIMSTFLATPSFAYDSGSDAWKNQVIMTIEEAKYKSCETDDQNINGNNSANSNDITRFQYDLDNTTNQGIYHGSGFFGGDLVGADQKVTHLKDLGITTALLYPIMQSDKNDFFGNLPTGYGITDWTVIDSNFRGAGQAPTDYSSYTNLVNDLHSPLVGGYRVNAMQDLSFSIAGFENPWFKPITSASNIDNFRRWDPITTSNNICGASGWSTFDTRLFFDLSSYYNEDVFSHDSNRADGNMGGTGYTYPSELVGNSVWAYFGYNNSVGFQFGSKLNGNNNAVKGSSSSTTTMTVPSSKYATVCVAAAADTANQSVTFRVNYSDATYTDNAVTVSRWDPPSAPSSYLVKFAHKHSSSADVSSPVYMYYYQLKLDPTKTVSSIALLSSSGAAKTHIFGISGFPIASPIKADLSSYYNEDAISWDANRGNGAIVNCGGLFPVESAGTMGALDTSAVANFYPNGQDLTNFAIGPRADGRYNEIKCTGQTITIPNTRYHEFRIAVFGMVGDQNNQNFVVHYTDGSSTTTTLNIKDWCASQVTGDVVVHSANHIHNYVGGTWIDDTTWQPKIWGYKLNADWTKTADSIILPNNVNVHVFAIDPVIKLDSSWGMPIVDHTNGMAGNTATFNYLWNNVVKFWMDKGLDGVRIDSVQNFRPSYWQTVINNSGFFKSTYPNAKIFGEAAVVMPSRSDPSGAPLPWQLSRYNYTNAAGGVNFDGVYDFDISDTIRSTFAQDVSATLDSYALINQSINLDNNYDSPWNQVAFFNVYENYPFFDLINKTTYPTYASWLPKIKLAAAYLFTINRIPLLFSGNEYLLEYGQGAAVGSDARKPGYLFTTAVTGDSTYQDNYAYMKALVAMRKNNPALISAEKMTSAKWIKQGATLFGFIRQQSGSPSIVAMFNNSSSTVSQFDTTLPAGVTGSNNYNFVLKSGSIYGATDSTVSWPNSSTLRISSMQPWEVKIIKINP